MQRIKIPFGGLNARQLEVLAELAEEYSDSIAHVTTRQDFQLHYIHIEDTPTIMRRLAAVGITTREACGNTVRNVTACPIAGVCRTQAFDVTPYAKATAYFMLGHPGRKTTAGNSRLRSRDAKTRHAASSGCTTSAQSAWFATANVDLKSTWAADSEPCLSKRSCFRTS